MKYDIEVIFSFQGTEAEAKAAAARVEEAVAQANGDLDSIQVWDDEGIEVICE